MSTNQGKPFFENFLADYFAECEEHLASARAHFLARESATGANRMDHEVLDELLRCFHSLKGLSAMVGVDEATQLAHHIEDYLRELKRPGAVASTEGIERMLAGIGTIEQVLAARRQSEPAPEISLMLLQLEAAAEELRSQPVSSNTTDLRNWRFEFRPSQPLAQQGITVGSVRNLLRDVGQVIHASPQVLPDGGVAFEFIVATTAPETSFEPLIKHGLTYSPARDEPISASQIAEQSAASALQQAGQGSLDIVRVEMHRLDDLMRIVGELVISRYRLDEALRSTTQEDRVQNLEALQEINVSMERQLRELREGVMRVRMVPIGQIFERMRFAVRGLEREAGKRIEVRIQGQDTEIDKVIVDKMLDPLLHLVRNAVSHGLESPEQRLASGKSPTGLLALSASTSGDTVLIEVQDDGRGMDIENILGRARALKLIGPDESLNSKRLLDVISKPGFTTRDEADLASGRGVGMAAVQVAVNELGGSIELETTKGQGTRFAIHLPLTLLITDSLTVKVAEQRFAVPQTAVREVLTVESSDVKVFENSEMVPFRGGALPILRLRKFFGLPGTDLKRIHLLVIGNGGSAIGLAVDRITGQREIVLRTLTDPLLRSPGIVGATELGDGRPVLILDPHSLIRAARDHVAVENRA